MNPHPKSRQADLAKIHIARKALGMDDSTYRAMLQTVAQVNSARDLTHVNRQAVLQHLRHLGWRPTNIHKGKPTKPPASKQALIGKIEAQLSAMKLPWSYAHSIAQRMFNLDSCSFCDPRQLHKIVAALAYRQKNQAREDQQLEQQIAAEQLEQQQAAAQQQPPKPPQ